MTIGLVAAIVGLWFYWTRYRVHTVNGVRTFPPDQRETILHCLETACVQPFAKPAALPAECVVFQLVQFDAGGVSARGAYDLAKGSGNVVLVNDSLINWILDASIHSDCLMVVCSPAVAAQVGGPDSSFAAI